MYAQLGNIQFELLPIETLDETFAWAYAEHQVIEGKPRLQFIAVNLDELSISVRWHFTFCDPDKEFATLKAEANLRQALPFIFANGKNLGRYVINRITKTTVATADNGRPLCIEAKLELKEFVDDNPLASQQAAAQKSAPGLQGKGPVVKPAPAPGNAVALAAGKITANATLIKVGASSINTLAGSIEAVAAGAAAELKAATAGITAQVSPMMAQAKLLATDGAASSQLIAGYAAAISGYSSVITRITSNLPGPLAKIGTKIAAINDQISGQSTGTVTLAQIAGSGSVEAGTRAQIITRMLP